MNLSLVSIEVEAFKNFAEYTRVQLGGLTPGLHLVRGVNHTNARLGSNGSGKSTLFSDAVTWCLYGRTVGGLRTTDVRSWLTDEPPLIALTFNDGEKDHVIQRGPKATELSINGRAVGQADVDALMGVTFEGFEQAVIWGQARPLFLDKKPAEKMTLLSDALGLERWERRAEAAGGRAKRLTADLSALDGELRGLEAAQDHAKAALEEAKAAADTWGKDHAARLEGLQSVLRVTEACATAVEDERGRADLAAEEVGVKLKLLRPDASAVQMEVHGLEGTVDRLEAAALKAQESLAEVGRHMDAFTNEGTCPLCGQKVAEKDASRHVRELANRAGELQIEFDQLGADAKQANKNLTKTHARFSKQIDALASLDAEERRLSAALLTLERRAAQTRAEVNGVRASLKSAEEERNPHRDAAAAARIRLKEIEKELREGDELASKLEASVERAQFWAKGFREVRLMIVDDVLNDLCDTTAAVLEDLGLGDWEVRYTTEHETKSGTTSRALAAEVRSPSAPEGVRWENYSGGEGQRLRLASALALGEVLLAHAGVRVDFRVLDEPTRGLSPEGVADLVEMLAQYAEEAKIKLYLIDHMALDSSHFASTITIEGRESGAAVRE